MNDATVANLTVSDTFTGNKPLRTAEHTTILVPARDCLITHTDLTARNQADLLAAVPYALEDELTQSVEQLHFIVGEAGEKGARPVIVIARQTLQHWLEGLADEVDCLLPDVLALPWQSAAWTVAVDGERALVRTARDQGFECELSQLATQLMLLNRQLDTPETLAVWLPASTPELALPEDCAARIQTQHYHEDFADWLLSAANPAFEMNLLSAEFQRSSPDHGSFKRWLPAVVLLLLAGLVHTGFHAYQIVHINRETAALEEQSASVFQQTFPEIKRVVNPRIQAEQQLQKMRAGLAADVDSDFLGVFADTMTAIASLPDMQVKALAWKQNQLQLQLLAASVSQVEQLETALKDKRLKTEILNAVNKEGRFQAQLKIEEAR